MDLVSFIRRDSSQIISEWETFAATLKPASDDMSSLALRDHIKDILVFVARDLESVQSASEQIQKSHGAKPKTTGISAAETHAALRLAGGFDLDQMVSEFRALRASVTKLWEAQLTELTHSDLIQLTRFNEALDQILTEAIQYYSKKCAASKDIFLGILGHDLQNPLGAIAMAASLTPRLAPLSDRQMMLLAQISDSAARATEIVSHLLDLTRARLGSGLAAVREPMNMDFVSKQMIGEIRALHPHRNFTLSVSGNLDGSWDKARIGQVFSNVLGNAVRFSFADTTIDVTVEGQADDVILSVHNEGIPIPADAIGGLFDSLTRAEVVDGEDLPRSAGLGLGLYITKEIVIAHGGTIGVTSSEDAGTTFTVRLPRAKG